MARRLPENPDKRRQQVFKRLYQNLEHFRCLLESGQMEFPGIVTIPDTGEEVYLADLMTGINELPPRQKQAFDLICLQGFTETAATKIMLPDSKWSTPCQQYADTALARMIAAYDAKQNGTWKTTQVVSIATTVAIPKVETRRPPTTPTPRSPVATPPPSDTLQKHLQAAMDDLLAQREAIDAEIASVEVLLKGKLAKAS